MSNASEFVIENSVLTEYVGRGGDVVIPEGVASIGNDAFRRCKGMTSVVIPSSVTTIGDSAFRGCEGLKTVVISSGVESIGGMAFAECWQLKEFTISSASCKFGKEPFGNTFPMGLLPSLGNLHGFFTDAYLKSILSRKKWNALNPNLRTKIFLSRQGKSMLDFYKGILGKDDAAIIGETLLKMLSGKISKKDCVAAENFLTVCRDLAEKELLQRVQEELKEKKGATKRKKGSSALTENQRAQLKEEEAITGLVKAVLDDIVAQGKTKEKVMEGLKELYGISQKELPSIKDKEGNVVDPLVIAWLLQAHEKMGYGYVLIGYEKSGVRPEIIPIIKQLDRDSWQQAILNMANMFLGSTSKRKKMFLAYPICRYADEETIKCLLNSVEKWERTFRDKDAPPIYAFRTGILYSETEEAVLFSSEHGDLARYAGLRRIDADAIKEKFGLAHGAPKNAFSDIYLLKVNGKPPLSNPQFNEAPEMLMRIDKLEYEEELDLVETDNLNQQRYELKQIRFRGYLPEIKKLWEAVDKSGEIKYNCFLLDELTAELVAVANPFFFEEEIVKLISRFPALKVAGVVEDFEDHEVVAFFSESGAGVITEASSCGGFDSKDDGGRGRWIDKIDMMHPYKGSYSDTRTGGKEYVDYKYPYKEKWEDLKYVREIDGVFYTRSGI